MRTSRKLRTRSATLAHVASGEPVAVRVPKLEPSTLYLVRVDASVDSGGRHEGQGSWLRTKPLLPTILRFGAIAGAPVSTPDDDYAFGANWRSLIDNGWYIGAEADLGTRRAFPRKPARLTTQLPSRFPWPLPLLRRPSVTLDTWLLPTRQECSETPWR